MPFDTLMLPVPLAHRLTIAIAASRDIVAVEGVASHQHTTLVASQQAERCAAHGGLTASSCSSPSHVPCNPSTLKPHINIDVERQTEHLFVPSPFRPPFPVPPHTTQRKRLTLGFLSYDFNDHPTAHLVEALFAVVRRSRQAKQSIAANLAPDLAPDLGPDLGASSPSRDTGVLHALADAEMVIFSYGKDDRSSYRKELESVRACLVSPHHCAMAAINAMATVGSRKYQYPPTPPPFVCAPTCSHPEALSLTDFC